MSENESNLTSEYKNQNPTNGFDVEERISSLMTYDTELSEIKNHIINKNIDRINSDGFRIIVNSAIPSFIVLILSLFVDISYVPVLGQVAQNFAGWLFPGAELLNQGVEPMRFWWLPFVIYIVFIACALVANKALRNELLSKGASEGGISRVIDRYSGIVNAIGTALPLLGAAFLLVSIKEGPIIFLGFSVPFEVKSIIILAIALLFDSVFDALALRYQEVQEEIKNVEKEYYYEKDHSLQKNMLNEIKDRLAISGGHALPQQIKKEDYEQIYKILKVTHDVNESFTKNLINMKNTMDGMREIKIIDPETVESLKNLTLSLSTLMGSIEKTSIYTGSLKDNLDSIRKIISDINNVKLPEEKSLKELQATANLLSETMNNMKDSTALKSLDNLVYLAGKR
jgi:hypothetical protein